MNATNNNTALVIAFVVVLVLFLLFGGGAMTGATMSGISWMWIPTLLTLGIGILLGWAIFEKK